MNTKFVISAIFLLLSVQVSNVNAFFYKEKLATNLGSQSVPNSLSEQVKESYFNANNKVAVNANTSKQDQKTTNNKVNNQSSANRNTSKTELRTILDNNTVNNLDDYSKSELLKKEVQQLNQELDALNVKVDNLEKENTQLKIDLQKYDNEEKRKLQKNEQIESLSEEARSFKASVDGHNIPDNYMSIQNLLIIGNIDLAEKQLKSFIDNTVDGKKSNEYLSSTSGSGFFVAYANYWLGKINNINGNYQRAAQYFSESYKITNYSNLSLMSLLGLIESLTRLSKDTEACTAIRQFQKDYSKAASSKNFDFDTRYLKMVDNFKAINRCQ